MHWSYIFLALFHDLESDMIIWKMKTYKFVCHPCKELSQEITLMVFLLHILLYIICKKRYDLTCKWIVKYEYISLYITHLNSHYGDVIKSMMASKITSLAIVYSTVYSGSDQRKNQSSVSLAFVRGINLWLVNSLHKGPVTQKNFPFDDFVMYYKNVRLFLRCWHI